MDNDIKPPRPSDNAGLPSSTPGQVIGSQQPDAGQTPSPAFPAPQPIPKPKKSKKKFLLVLLLLALLGGGAAAYWFLLRPEPAKAPAPSQQVSKVPLTAASGVFYISKSDQQVLTYNPVSKEQDSLTVKLPSGRATTGSIAGSNQPNVFSEGGQSMLIATTTFKGEGEGEIANYQLSLSKDGKFTDLHIFDDDEVLYDWVISPDGTTVYYLSSLKATVKTEAKADLYMMKVADKKPVLLKADTISGGDSTVKTPLWVDKDGVLYFYAPKAKAIEEHKVEAGKYSTRTVGSPDCTCSLTGPQALSPDGKTLLLDQVKDGEKGGFSYYLMSVADGKTTKLGEPDAEETYWYPWFWTPDGSKLAFGVTSFRPEEKPEPEPRIEVMDATTKQHQKIMSSANPKDSFSPMGWSLDGRLLAVTHNQDLQFYDMTNKEIIKTDIQIDTDKDTAYSYGWY